MCSQKNGENIDADTYFEQHFFDEAPNICEENKAAVNTCRDIRTSCYNNELNLAKTNKSNLNDEVIELCFQKYRSCLNTIPDCADPVIKIESGRSHTCALLSSGNVSCWGYNLDQRLGFNVGQNIGDNETPASIGYINLKNTAKDITVGDQHSCAILSHDYVKCWGDNQYGQLGYGHTKTVVPETPIPTPLVRTNAEIRQIVAGGYHTCALRKDSGKILCWGRNDYGQLGYGHINNITMPPTTSVDVGGQAIQLSAGRFHTCALLESGSVKCWGRNDYGQLGYGHTNNIGDDEPLIDYRNEQNPSALTDIPLGQKAIAVSAKGSNTCALLASGEVKCWGENAYGEAGIGQVGSIGNKLPLDGIADIGVKSRQIFAGASHHCAISSEGNVRCWGKNSSGQLGYGHTETLGDNEPLSGVLSDINIGDKVTQLSIGDLFTCALLNTGVVKCWGDNKFGQLGYGHTNNIGDNEVLDLLSTVQIIKK